MKKLIDVMVKMDILYPDLPIKDNIIIRHGIISTLKDIEPNEELWVYINIPNNNHKLNVLIHQYLSKFIDED